MLTKESKKKLKKQRMRDNLKWGEEDEGVFWYDEVLSEGDDDLVDIMEDLCEREERDKEEEEEKNEVERCLRTNRKLYNGIFEDMSKGKLEAI